MVRRSAIRRYARHIGRRFGPMRVLLFGSYARGNATEDSDVDLLVVMDHDKPRNVDQAIAIRLEADPSFPVDVLVRRPAEIAERLAANDSFLLTVFADGKILYE